ncbi:NUDIX domain-containing protein [Streptomyces sp. ISL-98]|uniref:nucleotide triphosphate diphosphatase NUDT15 n=1 Tax=Streptomyces sp. ISL-98 TaxID=2819192 RepID=UPI001BE55496|nr:NUDIX domain-containing protein [Streptomyces sp. ISL-98]MBT2508900.1 NUDIX domain-containing protein [Streptomyces sp. ISL-98]
MTAHPEAERPERARPTPNALTGVGVIVVDPAGRILLGLGHDGRWELPGGKVDPGESFEDAAVRELAEETALRADADAVRIVAVLMDAAGGITRVTAAAVLETAAGAPHVTEPLKIARWEWFAAADVPSQLFAPSAAVLRAWRPELDLPEVRAYCYPTLG